MFRYQRPLTKKTLECGKDHGFRFPYHPLLVNSAFKQSLPSTNKHRSTNVFSGNQVRICRDGPSPDNSMFSGSHELKRVERSLNPSFFPSHKMQLLRIVNAFLFLVKYFVVYEIATTETIQLSSFSTSDS